MARGENIYKRKDGRWEGRYPKGRKADGALYYGYIYGKTYRSVREQVLEKKVYYKASASLNLFQGTFLQWARLWLETHVYRRVKASTYTSYQTKLQVHILPLLGEKPLQTIHQQDIEQVVQHLTQHLAPSSVHSVFRVVKQCFEEATQHGYLLTNPCQYVVLPALPKKKITAFSWQEQVQLIKACQKQQKHLSVLLALDAGLRIGEVSGLQWADIDFKRSILHVRRTIQRVSVNHQTQLVAGTPKTRTGIRSIPLTEGLKQALIRAAQDATSPYVVSTPHHPGPIDPRTIRYRFARIKKQLGGIVGSFHMLRHSFATRCIAAGGNIAAVSSLLGHASIKMTLDTYTSSFMEDQRQVIAKLNTAVV